MRGTTVSAVTGLLSSVCGKGVRLWVHRCELHFCDPDSLLSSEEIELLNHQRTSVIAALMKANYFDTSLSTLAPRSSSEPAPLTFQQESALTYREPVFAGIFAARLRGALNVDILSKSLGAVIQRHEALRTRIIVVGTTLRQKVDEFVEFKLETVNLTWVSDIDVDYEVQRHIDMFVRQWLDAADSSFEARLLRLSEYKYVLVILWDNLFEDYTSAILLFRELWSFYRDFIQGRQSSLPRVPMQYADYAVWQRETYFKWLETHDDYWKQRLTGATCVQLPADNQVLNAQLSSHSCLEISFGETLSLAIHDLARCQRSLSALVVLTLCAGLLSRWSTQRDFLIPIYVVGRHYPKHLDVVGFFSHPLPLRIQLTGSETFMDLLKVVSQEFIHASKHLDIGKTLAYTPHPFKSTYFQWFNSSPMPSDAMVPVPSEWNSTRDGLTIESFPVKWPPPARNVDKIESPLIIAFANTAKGIVGDVQYRADLFMPRTIQRFRRNLHLLAEHMVRNSHRVVLDLELEH